jgi:Family of unknown function (DUF6491)
MKTLAPIAFVLAAVLALDASAQPPPAALPAKPPHPPHACFWRRNIENFAASDDTTLYVRADIHDVYELKLFSHCLDLDWVHRLGLESIGGFEPEICEGSNPGVDVVVRDIGIGRQRCPITAVRKLSPPEVAALPRQARP